MAWLQVQTTGSGEVRYCVYWRDPSGKPHGKVFARRRDAEVYGRLMEQWKAEGSYFDPKRGKITLKAFVEGEVLVAADLAAKTRSTYGWIWRTYVRPELGDRRLNTISRGDLKELLGAMRARGVGNPTVAKTASFLGSVFRRAVEDERLHRNPAARLRVAQGPPTGPVPLRRGGVRPLRRGRRARGRPDPLPCVHGPTDRGGRRPSRRGPRPHAPAGDRLKGRDRSRWPAPGSCSWTRAGTS